MDLVQLGLTPDPDMEPKRTRTLVVSVCIHILILAIIVLDPNLFDTTPKRIISIGGQDFDLDKTQLTELTMPPPPRSHSSPPLVQPPPQPKTETPPPPQPSQPQPPPPSPPPPKEMPAIRPDDILKEGARPDGKVQASRGNTPELRAGGGSDQQKAEPKPEPPKSGNPQIAQNINPNALGLPNFREQAGKILDQTLQQDRRPGIGAGQGPGQGRTGNLNAPEEPNFATNDVAILSDTKGYDFGPYLNGVVNRVRFNWYPLIPEIARLGKKGRVTIIFTITKNGTIQNLQTVVNSGTDALDRAAQGSITLSNPFSQIPSNFDGDHLTLQFTFLYNLSP